MTTRGVYVCFGFSIVVSMIFVFFSPVMCAGQQPRPSTESHESTLRHFLQKALTDPRLETDKTTRFASAIIKNDGNTKEEIVVYISGHSWCGTGGCRLWILEPDGETFKVIGEMTIVRPPIRVLQSKSHGHFDIGVWVQGGDIQPGYEALLRYDGKSYPNNPSVAPAQPLNVKVAGKVLIARNDEGDLLYN